jgi:hypothetical protein
MKTNTLNTSPNTIEANNLCSRKLWELLLQNNNGEHRESIFIELKKRNHYQREIAQLLAHH